MYLTDAELEPDPIVMPHNMQQVRKMCKGMSGNAIPRGDMDKKLL